MAVIPRTKQAITTLTPSEIEIVDAWAALTHKSRADVLRHFVLEGIRQDTKALVRQVERGGKVPADAIVEVAQKQHIPIRVP